MSNETDIAELRIEIRVLAEALDRERSDLRTLKVKLGETEKKLDATEKKISTAETVGRLVLWALLGASAFLGNFQQAIKWIRG